ncbi:trimeric intracellular cation channel family protein [Chitinivibrio alkaliphilus]|uniref:Putative membrane protein n=1 Tax=Chitinivibrio alkaliphilus ACht1 TaxID=1313304 RepID=U7D703_9BACT|nr:trimeric intracellular cation channel family protein [Chitinivibrio alkaliphilus]ERP30852.1 putative membrane protein [Chitinivibrio alkaliphilus ACht1]
MEWEILHLLDIFGTAVFAISGVMVAGRHRMDLFGGLVLSFVTALGGGTLRDLLLDETTVFWIEQELYLMVVLVTSIATFYLLRGVSIPRKLFLVFDALGLSVFSVLGAMKGYAVTGSISISLLMGVMTGVAGGMMRDILADDMPLILRREIYATASFFGAAVYIALHIAGILPLPALLLSSIVVLTIRLMAIQRNLSLPVLFLKNSDQG